MTVHKVSSKGQVTLPAGCRRELGIHPHDRVSIGVDDGKIVIRPVPDFMELEGFLGERLSDDEEEKARMKAVKKRVEGS